MPKAKAIFPAAYFRRAEQFCQRFQGGLVSVTNAIEKSHELKEEESYLEAAVHLLSGEVNGLVEIPRPQASARRLELFYTELAAAIGSLERSGAEVRRGDVAAFRAWAGRIRSESLSARLLGESLGFKRCLQIVR